MSFQPRPYQTEAVSRAVDFFSSDRPGNGLEILPTGSGKSVVIANIASNISGKTVVFQPSKEILEQNYRKYTSYGYRAGIYSASAGAKHLGEVTFATIGSVIRKKHIFREFSNIIIDECHLVNPEGGMYHDFIKSHDHMKVLGLTATPYRLSSTMEGSMLKFLTRTKPRIFDRILYSVQNKVLFDAGFLAPLEYFSFDVVDRRMLMVNSNGSDFDQRSLRQYYQKINMPQKTAYWATRLLAKRNNLLIFCSLLEEAYQTAHLIDGAVVLTGDTPKPERERILAAFTSGKIRCLVNVGVLTTGFDYPELECVLLARSTMSLALYYQMIGRVMRPHPGKQSGWVVDLGGNLAMFGKIETMRLEWDRNSKPIITNGGRQLTNILFSKA